MNAEVVKRFVATAQMVLAEYFNLHAGPGGPPRVVANGAPLDQVAVLLGLSGDLVGAFILSYSEDVALNVSRAMMSNPDYTPLDEMCISALSELSNMIGGVTTTELEALGYRCDIVPPAVMRGAASTVSTVVDKILQLPMDSNAGPFSLYLGLKEAASN